MGWFGDDVEKAGKGVSNITDGIRYLLTGDIPPEVRVSLEKLELKADEVEAELLKSQAKINEVEAQSPSIFKSGWRPFIGWIGAFGLFYHFIGYNALVWYIKLEGLNIDAPQLNSEGLFALVTGMLGIGGFRTYEKFKGVTK